MKCCLCCCCCYCCCCCWSHKPSFKVWFKLGQKQEILMTLSLWWWLMGGGSDGLKSFSCHTQLLSWVVVELGLWQLNKFHYYHTIILTCIVYHTFKNIILFSDLSKRNIDNPELTLSSNIFLCKIVSFLIWIWISVLQKISRNKKCYSWEQ